VNQAASRPLNLWFDPAEEEALSERLNAALGGGAWRRGGAEASVGVYATKEVPLGVPPLCALLALHAQARPGAAGCWVQHLPDPSPEALGNELRRLVGSRGRDLFNRAILEAIRDHTTDAIYILDDRGYFVFVNQHFQKLMGLTFAEICRPDFEFSRLIAPEGEAVIRAREEAFAEGVDPGSHYEFQAMNGSGSSFPAAVSTARMVFHGNAATVGILRDVSEPRRVREALERQNQELTVLNRVANAANRYQDLDLVLADTLDAVAEHIGFDAFIATRSEEEDGLFRIAAHRGLPAEVADKLAEEGTYDVPVGAYISDRSLAFSDLRTTTNEKAVMHPSISEHFRFKLLVPIVHGERSLGTLQAYNIAPGGFDPRDASLMESVANQLGAAMYRAWLHREQATQIAHLRTLDALATTMIGGAAAADLLAELADAAMIISGADVLTLWWATDDDLQAMQPRLQRGADEPVVIIESAQLALDRGDSWLDENGFLFVPVRRGGQGLGVFALGWERLSLGIAARVETLELLASHAALAAQQARLQRERDGALRRHFESQKLASLGGLAAGVAHDFNNVLAAILGRAQLLERQLDRPEHLASVKVIEQAALDGAGTVRRIQEFSRQSADRDEAVYLANLDEVVRDTIAQTSSQWLERAGGTVELDLRLGHPPPVLAEARDLREVYTNMVNNALDAMSSGGCLRLETGVTDGFGWVACKDDGKGIDAHQIERIFDPFYTTKGQQGTGLGLAVSFGIVQRAGGRIEVESEPGNGAAFIIYLPLAGPVDQERAVQREAALVESPATEAENATGATILVTEDDEMVRELLVAILSENGYCVVEASDGNDCLAKLADITPDLILTDLGMPNLDGWGLAERLRSDYPDLRFGFITGWGATVDPSRVREAGACLVVAKPFRYEEVLHQVGEALRDS
jgi:PAS domain S-box-containing protein